MQIAHYSFPELSKSPRFILWEYSNWGGLKNLGMKNLAPNLLWKYSMTILIMAIITWEINNTDNKIASHGKGLILS